MLNNILYIIHMGTSSGGSRNIDVSMHYILLFIVPSPYVRITVAEFLNRDLGKVSEWCDLWGMKLNESKTKTMDVSRSRAMISPSHPH